MICDCLEAPFGLKLTLLDCETFALVDWLLVRGFHKTEGYLVICSSCVSSSSSCCIVKLFKSNQAAFSHHFLFWESDLHMEPAVRHIRHELKVHSLELLQVFSTRFADILVAR